MPSPRTPRRKARSLRPSPANLPWLPSWSFLLLSVGRSAAVAHSSRLPSRWSNAPALDFRSDAAWQDAGTEVPPQTEQPVGRKQHDRQEHDADHEVEALARDDVDGEILHQHEDDGANERADRMAHAAQHGEHQNVEH